MKIHAKTNKQTNKTKTITKDAIPAIYLNENNSKYVNSIDMKRMIRVKGFEIRVLDRPHDVSGRNHEFQIGITDSNPTEMQYEAAFADELNKSN